GQLVPSNGIPADRVGSVAMTITITNDATFDGETGAISGAITRAAVTGVDAGIRFDRVGPYGVFTFAKLSIGANATVDFNGDNAIVFLVATSAAIDGTIDIAGGAGAQGQAGAGGGDGAIYGVAAHGCGPGHAGGTGGDGGPPKAMANAAAGGGGGAGGGILLEAITIEYAAGTVLAANGGGGGGAATNTLPGIKGENAHAAAQVALGGATGMAPSTAGGNGGFAMTPAKPAADSITNS